MRPFEEARLELHSKLCSILGSKYVYFQVPGKMTYPCIRYELSKVDVRRADNSVYGGKRKWTVMFIGHKTNSEVPDKLFDLPYVEFDRAYTYDNLNHSVYTLYF